MEKWDACAHFRLENENENTSDQGFPTWGTFAYPKGHI